MENEKTEEGKTATVTPRPFDESVSNFYFTIPSPASRHYHIFGEDGRSLCKKYMMLRVSEDMKAKVFGTEKFKKGQDCRACFKQAGLKTE